MPHHLLSIQDLSLTQIHQILDLAAAYQGGQDGLATLRNKIICHLFFEHSTRTKMSFEMACARLGAQSVSLVSQTSSMLKGENLIDTLQTIQALRPDLIVMRHNVSGAPYALTPFLTCPLVNAGDGCHQHPSQALLDLFTIRQIFKDTKGLNMAICGDVYHSRVARSLMALLPQFGVNIRLVSPKSFMPHFAAEAFGFPTYTQFESGIRDVDIIYCLRIQKERMSPEWTQGDCYYEAFGLTEEKWNHCAPLAYLMHPGPVNRGVELALDGIDSNKNNLILTQVQNGLWVRMAILDFMYQLNQRQ